MRWGGSGCLCRCGLVNLGRNEGLYVAARIQTKGKKHLMEVFAKV